MHKVYTNIIEIAGDVITVEAEGVGFSEIAEVPTDCPSHSQQFDECLVYGLCAGRLIL